MSRPVIAILFLALSLFALSSAAAQSPSQSIYYDFGVFAYEEGDYEGALKNFNTALESDPDNPYLHHFLGKTYMALKQFEAAKEQLKKALEIDPEIPELKFDTGMLYFKTGKYYRGAELFSEIVASEPDNVRAHYQAGINYFRLEEYQKAVNHFVTAGEKSPTLTDNSFYYAGVCYYKLKELEKALEMFEYVRDHTTSPLLRGNALVWLQNVDKRRASLKPFRIFFKIGRQYDDNVRLEPLDLDLYADEGDFATQLYFSGSYQRRFGTEDEMAVKAGYNHYQILYDDLDGYDLTASLFDFSGDYRNGPLTYGLTYTPSYFWLDGDGYLQRHRFIPRVRWRMKEGLFSTFSYGYSINAYEDDEDKDGQTHEPRIDLIYGIPDLGLRFFGGMGYEIDNADAAHESYDLFRTNIGLTWKMFWNISLTLAGKYEDRKYDGRHPFFGVVRNDDKFGLDLSLSRRLFYDWLGGTVDYDYTKNDSNLKDHQYERNVLGFSIFVIY